MSKKKHKSHRQERNDFDTFDEFDDDRYAYQEIGSAEEFEEDEEELFDVDRWRDDLFERGRQRERMRSRDLSRGILPTSRIPLEHAFEFEEEEEEE